MNNEILIRIAGDIPEKQAFGCLNELYMTKQLFVTNNCTWKFSSKIKIEKTDDLGFIFYNIYK